VNWSRLPLVIAVAALVTAALAWIVTSRQVEDLREGQRALVADVAAARNMPAIDVARAPARGSESARVTLVEFSDYECPFCIRHFTQTMPLLEAAYIQTGRVRYVFRDFPVDQLHPEAVRAHVAGRCAEEQGRFWQLHPRLFSPAGSHQPPILEQHAVAAGLTLETYRACIARTATADAVRKSAAEAESLGANGTPFFFIGVRDRNTGLIRVLQTISGAHPYEVFAKALDAALARVGG
jgi:protein-disulfide isomerase